jgi:hypothetical protein
MAWAPIGQDEADDVLETFFGHSGATAEQMARVIEAWMVKDGAPPNVVKAQVEEILGPVD